jgi:hypothetical protein
MSMWIPSARTADAPLPNVVTFTPGTVAEWDPWCGLRNGKGPLLDHFPYVSPPPAAG